MHKTTDDNKQSAVRSAKDVLTTGDVARICKVAPRTVSKWFDSGKLRGYRIPGSKDRRIPVQQLIRFMQAHNIPLDGLDSGTTRVLVVETDREIAELLRSSLNREAGYQVRLAPSAFEAGAAAQSEPPHVMLIDVTMPGFSPRDAVRTIRNVSELNGVKLVAMAGTAHEGDEIALQQAGFDAVLSRPFDVRQAVRAIEKALGLVSAA